MSNQDVCDRPGSIEDELAGLRAAVERLARIEAARLAVEEHLRSANVGGATPQLARELFAELEAEAETNKQGAKYLAALEEYGSMDRQP